MNKVNFEKWDMQHHILPEFYLEEMKKLGIEKISGLPFPKWNMKNSLAVMKSNNISKAFLSFSAPGVHFGDDDHSRKLSRKCNNYMIDSMIENPEKIGAFASVPLPDVDGAIKEVKYALDEKKMDGVMLMSNVKGRYLGDKTFRPFFEELDKRNAVVFIHPHTPVGKENAKLLNTFYWWFIETTQTMLTMIKSGYHKDFPNIKYFVAHGGGVLPAVYPVLVERLKDEYPNIESELEEWKKQLFLDTAKVVNKEAISSILNFTDPEHIVFASDYVWAGKNKVPYWIKEINNLELDDRDKENIFKNNAQRVFNGYVPEKSLAIATKSKRKPAKMHYHGLPEDIISELKIYRDTLKINTLEKWDKNNASGKVTVLDIPGIWKLENEDRTEVFKIYNQKISKIKKEIKDDYRFFGAINIDDSKSVSNAIDYATNALKLDGLCIFTDLSQMGPEKTLEKEVINNLTGSGLPIMIHPKESGGIPIENSNYLDAAYFIGKIFYSDEIKSFGQTQLYLTHTAGIVPYMKDSIGLLYYLQFKKWKLGKYIFDFLIRKKLKGHMYLDNLITDD